MKISGATRNNAYLPIYIILVSLLILFGCSSGLEVGASDKPENVVKKALQAAQRGDEQTFENYTIAGKEFLWDKIINCEGANIDGFQYEVFTEYDIVSGQEVTVVRVYDGRAENGGFSVVKVGDTWLMDDWIGEVRCTTKANQSNSTGSGTSNRGDFPNTPVPTSNTNARVVTPTASSSADQSLRKVWTIRPGDLRFITVDKEGKIYGFGDNIYAVLSPDGKVISAENPDLQNCMPYGYAKATGQVEANISIIIHPDGRLFLVDSFGSKYCSFYLRDSFSLDQKVVYTGSSEETPSYFPYSSGEMWKKIVIPDGFEKYMYALVWLVGKQGVQNRDTNWIYYNRATQEFAHFSPNGEIIKFKIPEGAAKAIEEETIEFWRTPWGEVYITYPEFDVLGNKLGDINYRVSPEGIVQSVGKLPDATLRDKGPLLYIPQFKSMYFLSKDVLSKYDLNFIQTANYKLPEEINFKDNVFIGMDGNLYYFNLTELTKYSLPDAESTKSQVDLQSIDGSVDNISGSVVSPSDEITATNASPVIIEPYCSRYGESPIKINSNQPVILKWRWDARTKQQVEDHISAAVYEILLDGVPITADQQGDINYVSDGSFYRVEWYANVGILDPGQHTTSRGITWLRMISDGWDTFGPGGKYRSIWDDCTIIVN